MLVIELDAEMTKDFFMCVFGLTEEEAQEEIDKGARVELTDEE